jgi:demethylmenaquinone methyltransferase/2-methoxy-6-polyprenyl-1,4-benzoquinol methylase
VSAPAQGTLAPAEVERMFDRIAGPYDLMNRVMTAGLDQRWRALAAAETALPPGGSALDACCGTGDLALAVARRAGPSGRVVGVDFSSSMLERARAKQAAPGSAPLEWLRADATHLPFGDASFDAATIGFGLRNLPDIGAGLRELARVVRPGGRVVCLEITTPQRPPLSTFYRLWFDRLVPLLGRLLDADAYRYLPASVRRFPAALELGRRFELSGLRDVRYRLLAGGIVALHVGVVPGREEAR